MTADERIGADAWRDHVGHVARYRFAKDHCEPGWVVADVACGIGYGAEILGDQVLYVGFDRPGVPRPDLFGGEFVACDLNDPDWVFPARPHMTICVETLEHLTDPQAVAAKLAARTSRRIIVSVPTVPTAYANHWHLWDFEPDDIPPMFPGFEVAEVWEQPEELSHVWLLDRIRQGGGR